MGGNAEGVSLFGISQPIVVKPKTGWKNVWSRENGGLYGGNV